MSFLSNLVYNTIKDFDGIDNNIIKLLADSIEKKENEYYDGLKKEWENERKTFKWTFKEFERTESFLNKYQASDTCHPYILVDNTTGKEVEGLFNLFNSPNKIKDTEKKLNSKRFVVLEKYFEDKYDDKIMESCHGKNWMNETDKYTGKPVTPYHLVTDCVIFDTVTGEVIYENYNKNTSSFTYINMYNNLAVISKHNTKTIFFNMPDRKIILESSNDIIETKNFLIVGKTRNYSGFERESATLINKHSCSTVEID